MSLTSTQHELWCCYVTSSREQLARLNCTIAEYASFCVSIAWLTVPLLLVLSPAECVRHVDTGSIINTSLFKCLIDVSCLPRTEVRPCLPWSPSTRLNLRWRLMDRGTTLFFLLWTASQVCQALQKLWRGGFIHLYIDTRIYIALF